jgi:DNA-binding beta-propeller fold protein YncE
MSPEQVAGVTASPITNMIYVAQRGRLGAFDMRTEKKVWEGVYDGKCCERPQVTPDGRYLVVGSDLQDYWYVVDARTGKLLHKIQAPLSPSAHNLVLSPDGKRAFMSPNNPIMTIGDVATGKVIKTIQFSDHIRPFVLNHDATRIYANINNLDGFEIADVATGKILKHIEVSGDWKAKWNRVPRARYGHGCPSHGIALVNNEKEIWVADGVNTLIHIFDNTQETPKEIATIKPSDNVYWFTIGLDGKYAYVSSGDIIDTKTRKIVGQMKDEFGRTMISEKLLDMTFVDGKAQRVSNQFGNGFGDINASGHTNMSSN